MSDHPSGQLRGSDRLGADARHIPELVLTHGESFGGTGGLLLVGVNLGREVLRSLRLVICQHEFHEAH